MSVPTNSVVPSTAEISQQNSSTTPKPTKPDEQNENTENQPELSEKSKQAILSQLHKQPSIDVKTIQGKWQMASVTHFLEIFRDVLPLKDISTETAEDLTPALLERAIAEPDLDTRACLALRDVIMTLLFANGVASKKNLAISWFQSLRLFISSRKTEFLDCFQNGQNVLNVYENGMDFLVGVGWKIRLGMLLSLCDITAQEAQVIREAIRESELATSATKSEIEGREFRLAPMGRCSQKRFHYKVGKTRVYSGYKRKGPGILLVECTDSKSMREYSNALFQSSHERDKKLGTVIKEKHLAPLEEFEEKMRKKMEKKLLSEIQKEESRRRNAGRPRRSKASYMLDS